MNILYIALKHINCYDSEDFVTPRCDFVTAEGDIQGANSRYFCIFDKKTSYGVNRNFLHRFLSFFVR